MASQTTSSTQPQLHGEALRNLRAARRPVVKGQPSGRRIDVASLGPVAAAVDLDAAEVWQDDLPPRTSHIATGVVWTGRTTARSATAVGAALKWLLVDSETALRTGLRRFIAWTKKKDDELEKLAVAARYSAVSNRFMSVAVLNAEEHSAVERLNYGQRMIHQAGSDIALEGESVSPSYIVSGWASRFRLLANGRRQILGLLVPGDAIGAPGCEGQRADVTVTALTTVETVDASGFLGLARQAERYPGLSHAIDRMAAQGVVFADNQVIRLGSMTEARRVAHLLLELHWRLRQAGLGNDVLFPLPLTAETIADALGMAANRVRWALRRLRAQKMFAVRYGRASVLTRRKLDLNGDFRPPDACPCGRAHAVH